MMKTKKVIKDFDGFESLHGWDEDLMWVIQQELDFPPEFTGTIRMTVEYIPEEDLSKKQEWVNKKRFDALQWAYNELVDHHATHHKGQK